MYDLLVGSLAPAGSGDAVRINRVARVARDNKGITKLVRYRVTEHKISATAIQGTIEYAMKTNFYYGSLTRYHDTEYRVRKSKDCSNKIEIVKINKCIGNTLENQNLIIRFS